MANLNLKISTKGFFNLEYKLLLAVLFIAVVAGAIIFSNQLNLPVSESSDGVVTGYQAAATQGQGSTGAARTVYKKMEQAGEHDGEKGTRTLEFDQEYNVIKIDLVGTGGFSSCDNKIKWIAKNAAGKEVLNQVSKAGGGANVDIKQTFEFTEPRKIKKIEGNTENLDAGWGV